MEKPYIVEKFVDDQSNKSTGFNERKFLRMPLESSWKLNSKNMTFGQRYKSCDWVGHKVILWHINAQLIPIVQGNRILFP